MKRFPKLMVFLAGLFLICVSASDLSAQDGAVSGKAYIYCRVWFDDFKVDKERQLGSYTQKYKERAIKMMINCTQYDTNLKSLSGTVTDEEGNPRAFSTYMSGLNWLGTMGWELMAYPSPYRSDMTIFEDYFLRLDVSGMTYEQINEKLSAFQRKE